MDTTAIRLNAIPAWYYRTYALLVTTGAVALLQLLSPGPLAWTFLVWTVIALIAIFAAHAVRSFFDVYVSALGVSARGRDYRRITIAWTEPQRLRLKSALGLAYLEIESLQNAERVQIGIGWGASKQLLAEITGQDDLPAETRALYLQILQ